MKNTIKIKFIINSNSNKYKEYFLNIYYKTILTNFY